MVERGYKRSWFQGQRKMKALKTKYKITTLELAAVIAGVIL